MKKLAFLSAIFGCLSLCPAFANDQPRGSLMEVHSCELYAADCVVSSEATLGGVTCCAHGISAAAESVTLTSLVCKSRYWNLRR